MRKQSQGEEIANSIIHAVGAALSIAALVLLVIFAARRQNTAAVTSFSIYGATLICLYLSSTLYHSLSSPSAKRVFRVLDHACIYLAIAGTYTPILLVSLGGAWGWTLFGIIWGLALTGILLKVFFLGRLRIVSVLFYLAMGWLIVIALKPMLEHVPAGLIVWLAAGGLCYTLGVIFYAWKKMPYQHAVWHLFVLGGSVAHFFGLLYFVAA